MSDPIDGVQAGWAHASGMIELRPPNAAEAVSVADRELIVELFARYAMAYDERRLDILADCFEPEGILQAQLGPKVMARFDGVRAIIDGTTSVMSEQGIAQRRHMITNVVLDAVAGGEVSATAYVTVYVAEDGVPMLGAVAVYRAAIAQTSSGWRFREIIVGMDSYVGAAPQR